MSLRRRLFETYFAFDPRSLGLFRIALGLVLLADLLRRFQGIDAWYTEAGIVPARLLVEARFSYLFSPFLHLTTHAQAAFGMAACAIVYALFTVGFMTRLFHVLSLVAVVGLNNRIFMLENGGQYVLNLLCVWSLFLPLGRRFSLDALLRSLRARRERTPREADERESLGGENRPVVSFAVLALLLQFAAIYLFNTIQKTGLGWRDGTAVHYALHDERLVTVFGVWLRETVPHAVLQALSFGTLALEGAAVLLIMSPFATRRLRLVAAVAMPLLHVGFNLCLHLGVFSLAMMSFFPLLLAREHWEWLARRRRERAGGALLGGTASVAPPLPAMERRGWVWPRRAAAAGREAAVLVLLVAAVGDLAESNPAWPDRLAFRPHAAMSAIVWLPRLHQYWQMFAPDPARTIKTLAVEAWTVDGRVVDPYNEIASRYPTLPPPDGRSGLPPRLGQNQFFGAYSDRIVEDGFAFYRPALRNWIFRYSERTGNPSDRIVRMRVWRVASLSPLPGSRVRARMTRELLFAVPAE